VRPSRLLPPVLTALAILIVWQWLPPALGIKDYLLPRPSLIYHTIVKEASFLVPAAGRTALAAVLGLLSAIAGGLFVASLFTMFVSVRRSLLPWVLILQMTPVIVLVPLIAIWLGSGLASIVAITFLISFFPIAASASAGMSQVDPNYADLFKVMKASRAQMFWKLRVPGALPSVITGVKIAATLATVGAVSGEYMVGTNPAQSGLGYLMQIYWSRTDTAAVFAVAVVACVVGYCFVAVVNAMGERLLRRD
jgi:NitT/TauT family transport system permease protein